MTNIDPHYAGLGLFVAASFILVFHILVFKPTKPTRAKIVTGAAAVWLVASIIAWPVASGSTVIHVMFAGLLGFSIARQSFDPSCRESQ